MSTAIAEQEDRAPGPPALANPPAVASASYAFSPSLVTLRETKGVQAEGIRALRTHVMAQHIDRGRRALAICAPNRGVGCTFIATNLAIALSQIGVKTVLVDGDLHRPGIESLIRPSIRTGGLVGCLSSTAAEFGAFIDFEVSPNLSIIYAGDPADDARELLASDRFQMLMDCCLRDFDMTIVDTPAANTSSDVRRISTVVGYSLIVAGRDRTFMNDIKTLAQQLHADHAQVVGTVLNKA